MAEKSILQRAKEVIFRKFNPAETPLSGGTFSFLNAGNAADVAVTSETALSVSTFYTCVRSISEDIAKLPFKIQQKDSKGNKIDQPSHPAARLLNQRPNGFSTPFTLKQTLIERALRKGNGYAFIERDENATPIALYFLEPESVVPILKDRKLIYKVVDPVLGLSQVVQGEDMFHLRGFGDAYIGKSVIQYARESIANGIALQEYGNEFFAGGGSMLGLLTTKGIADETKLKAFKNSFTASVREDKVGVINGDATFTKMSVDPNEAQFIEATDSKVNDIARWFRMPLGKLQKDNVTNIEALEIQYVNDTLMPWIVRFEQECEAKLLTTKEQPIYDAKVNVESLLRGDSAAFERRAKTLWFMGASSANDILRSMDMNTIGPDGDRRYVPVNSIPTDMVTNFWQSKDNTQADTASPDNTGAGQMSI